MSKAREYISSNTIEIRPDLKGIKDDNNCTIKSFSIAYGIPYPIAYEIGKQTGRRHGKGHYMHGMMEYAKKQGYEMVEITIRKSLYQFLLENPRGRFIAVRRGHAFPIVNGKIYDVVPNPPKSIIKRLWQVKSKKGEVAQSLYGHY